MTLQRKVIFEVIQNSPRHMTAEQIYLASKAILPSIAIGTVYRNLGLMAESKEILRLEIPGQPDHFDKTLLPHHHGICVRCGEVFDIPALDLTEKLTAAVGMPVESYDLTVRVLCRNCRSQELGSCGGAENEILKDSSEEFREEKK